MNIKESSLIKDLSLSHLELTFWLSFIFFFFFEFIFWNLLIFYFIEE